MPLNNLSERKTAQRRLVLQIVSERHDHPTAQEIYEHARATLPSISLGTIYRNLQRLVEQGHVVESKNGQKPARYEARRHRHYHIHCTECGSLEDVSVPYQESLDRKVARQLRYRLNEHRLEFFGVCPRCQSKSPRHKGASGIARHPRAARIDSLRTH